MVGNYKIEHRLARGTKEPPLYFSEVEEVLVGLTSLLSDERVWKQSIAVYNRDGDSWYKYDIWSIKKFKVSYLYYDPNKGVLQNSKYFSSLKKAKEFMRSLVDLPRVERFSIFLYKKQQDCWKFFTEDNSNKEFSDTS